MKLQIWGLHSTTSYDGQFWLSIVEHFVRRYVTEAFLGTVIKSAFNLVDLFTGQRAYVMDKLAILSAWQFTAFDQNLLTSFQPIGLGKVVDKPLLDYAPSLTIVAFLARATQSIS